MAFLWFSLVQVYTSFGKELCRGGYMLSQLLSFLYWQLFPYPWIWQPELAPS
ncbi:hypothetical protein BDP27DRAFT_1336810 [Rhodocollybia butyracea]|uniref:Uncharacterized protein n=1 Tax=Rhodocollybia butyracea TaxID=206335 RepID=A0A9P5PFP4_9AGAR|nr:hypothetical protein BDP27DRAFT_1336810 [Rhodocollybia butyracea]